MFFFGGPMFFSPKTRKPGEKKGWSGRWILHCRFMIYTPHSKIAENQWRSQTILKSDPEVSKSTQALQERDSTCIIGSVYKALTIAVVWYSLDFFNSLPRLTDTSAIRCARIFFTQIRCAWTQILKNVRLMLPSSACPLKPCRRSQMATFSWTGLQFLRSLAFFCSQKVSRSVFFWKIQRNPTEWWAAAMGFLWCGQFWPGLRWVPHSSLILQLIYMESWLGTALVVSTKGMEFEQKFVLIKITSDTRYWISQFFPMPTTRADCFFCSPSVLWLVRKYPPQTYPPQKQGFNFRPY